MIPTERFARVEVQPVEELRAGLSTHARQSESVWFVTPLKGPGTPYLSGSAVIDELLCFGWLTVSRASSMSTKQGN